MAISDRRKYSVRNTSGKSRFFGYLGPRGRTLAAAGAYSFSGHPGHVIQDARDRKSFDADWDAGTVTVGDGIDGPWSFGNPDVANPNPALFTVLYEDFVNPVSATASEVIAWQDLNDGATGTNAYQSTLGGWFNLVTAAAQDDYHAFASSLSGGTSKAFQLAAGKPLWFEARFKLSEGNTNKSAWWFGLSDTLTTGGLQAGTAGPLASFDGFLLYKNENSLLVNFQLSDAAVKGSQAGIATFVSNTITRVGAYFDGVTTITPFVDVGLGWVQGNGQTVAPATQSVGSIVYGTKAGAGGVAETLQVDLIRVLQGK